MANGSDRISDLLKGSLDTGYKPVWSCKSTSTSVFVPLSGWVPSVMFEEVRLHLAVRALSGNPSITRAYNTSDDGITASGTVTTIGSAVTTEGWSIDQGSATTLSTDRRNLIRFGVYVKNASGAQVAQGQARLVIRPEPTSGRVLRAGPMKVWSDGSTTQIFHAATAPISSQGIGNVRATFEQSEDSQDCQIQPAYQVSDAGLEWYSGASSAAAGTFTTFETERTGAGITYASSYTSFAPAEEKGLVRFGFAVRNGSAGLAEACNATLKVDVKS